MKCLKMKRGWFGNSHAHKLARQGIKSKSYIDKARK